MEIFPQSSGRDTPTRAAELEAEERRRAADRMRATQLNGRDSTGEPVFGSGNFPEPNATGQSRDFVGAAFGMSGKTYAKARAWMGC